MKQSNYNFTGKLSDNSNYIFNSVTCALALINDYELDIIKSIKNRDVSNTTNYDFLLKCQDYGFIIEDEVNELVHLQYEANRDKYNSSGLTLTILPSLSCNFDCIYCYEKNSLIESSKISKDVIESIIKLLDTQKTNIKTLNIIWYGGEPLMQVDLIFEMSMLFITYCDNNNIEYSAEIITNGYYLTRQNIKKLVECRVMQIQITVDGNKESHDERRKLRDGSGTYTRIMRNIEENIDILPQLSIRVNVDKTNMDKINQIYNWKNNLDNSNKLFIYIGRTEEIEGVYSKEVCFNYDDFFKYQMEFYDQHSLDDLISLFPKPILNNCMADTSNNLIINYNGDLYKCISDIGQKEKILGNILTNNDNDKLINDYLLYNIFSDEHCRNCKYLPICMGGCPRNRTLGERRCTIYKKFLDKIIRKTILIQDSLSD